MRRSLNSLRVMLYACVLAIGLAPAMAPAAQGIHGKVVTFGDSTPIVGAYVHCVQLETTKTVVRTAIAGAEGAFSIVEMAAGKWLVMGWANNFQPNYQTVVVQHGLMLNTTIVLKTQSGAEFGVLEGQVVNAKTGGPIPGAWVYYGPDPADGPVIAMLNHVIADASGHFRVAALRPGKYISYAQANGFATAHQGFTITAGGVTPMRYALEPTAPTTPGAISGRVMDANTSLPLVGARVYYGQLYSSTTEFRWFDTSGTPTQPFVLTNSNGEYKIESLAPGGYYLLATAERHIRQEKKVVVASGQTARADFKLRPEEIPHGSISGVVTNTSGTAVVGAKIYYSPYEMMTFQAPYVVTGSDGRYSIPWSLTGYINLNVTAEGYLPQKRTVRVIANQTTTANFELRRSTVATGVIFGRVVDSKTSAPLSGVEVRVYIASSNTSAGEAVVGSAFTNGNGEYRIVAIPAGTVMVGARLAGYVTAWRSVAVVGGTEKRVDFRLTTITPVANGKIIGVVRAAANEQPIAGAIVRIVPVNIPNFELHLPPDFTRETVTDENGQYGFEKVPVGSYQVVAAKPGFRQQTKPATVAANTTSEVNFLLEAAPVIEYGRLTGRVVDAVTSLPIVQAWVAVQVEIPNSVAATPTRLAVYTNPLGYYVIERVPVGEWTVYAARKGYMPQKATVQIVKDQTAQINFRLPSIQNPGVLEGTVRDTTSGLALANIHVIIPLIDEPHIANSNTALHAVTNSLGHYRISGIPAGERKVTAFGREYIPDTEPVTIVAGAAAQLDFNLLHRPLELTQSVSLQVVNARSGSALSDVKLTVPVCLIVEPFSEWDLYQTISNSGGAALLTGIPTGSFFIVGSAPNFATGFMLVPGKYETTAGSGTQSLLLSPVLTGNAASSWAEYF